MTFVIGSDLYDTVSTEISSVYRGSPNVIIEYMMSSTNSDQLDEAIEAISSQISSGAEYIASDDVSFPIYSNAVIKGNEYISADLAFNDDEEEEDEGSNTGVIVVAVSVVIVVCIGIGVTVCCIKAKRKRDRELEALAAVERLPGFQVVHSDDMPFETGKKGHHAFVPSLSFDIGRITPALHAVNDGHSRVPSLKDLDGDSSDEAGGGGG